MRLKYPSMYKEIPCDNLDALIKFLQKKYPITA